MTVAADATGCQPQCQDQALLLETGKSFRFLFLGGTDPAAGASVAFEAFSRAFASSDDAALVVATLEGTGLPLDLSWLQELFSDELAPEAEVLASGVAMDHLPLLLEQCQALLCLGDLESNRSLVRAAADAGIPVIVPESQMEALDVSHALAYPVLHNGVTAAGAPLSQGVHPQDLAGVLRRIMAEPNHAAKKGEELQRRISTKPRLDDARAESPKVITPPPFSISWGASAFNYSGYAKVTRTIMSTLDRHGANWGYHGHSSDKRFLAEMKADPQVNDYWTQLACNKVTSGIYCSFHPPFRVGGQSFYRALLRENPDFAGIAAVTMFETDRLPTGWDVELNAADEVWVPCQFNIDSFTKGGVDPTKLRKLHLGIDAAPFTEKRTPLEIPGRRSFNFVSIFDWALRKGWDVLLRAWFDAFTADDDVSLTIRAYPAIEDQAPIRQQIADFMAREGIDPQRAAKLILIEDFVSEEDMPALYQAADCFVLPSRGEGWGLPYMEAMATGLPVIGTRWSGQLEFMHDANSFLVDIEGLVPIFPEQTRMSAYYESHHLWAQPSACHLKDIMRRIVARPQEARDVGRRAQEEVCRLWTADRMVENLYRLAGDLHERKTRKRNALNGASLAQPHADRELPNVAWTGPLYDASGYADEGRNYVHAIKNMGACLRTFPMNWSPRSAGLDAEEERTLRSFEDGFLKPGRATVMVQHTIAEVLEPSRAGYPCAGRTMFETDSLPDTWVERCNALKRIWVPSQFNVESFSRAGVRPEKLRILHPAIDEQLFGEDCGTLDLSTDRRVKFLSIFDWTHRKGWDILIKAWANEFSADDDVALVLKVWSAFGRDADYIANEIQEYIRQDLGMNPDDCAEIVLFDHLIPEADMPKLYAAADAFVLPTRGEGWGRPIMEAMASGTIALATNWSAMTEYMTPHNSLPIDCSVVACSEAAVKQVPWFKGHHWAEPSVPHLQFLMRLVYKGDPRIQEYAARGREDVLKNFGRPAIQKRLQELLLDLAYGD